MGVEQISLSSCKTIPGSILWQRHMIDLCRLLVTARKIDLPALVEALQQLISQHYYLEIWNENGLN